MIQQYKAKAEDVNYKPQPLHQVKNFIINGIPDRMFSTEKEALNKIKALRSKRNEE